METVSSMSSDLVENVSWRHVLLMILVFGSLGMLLTLEPIAQDREYHAFADARTFFGIPNCLNVASNLPFLMVGILGFKFCLGSQLGPARYAWTVLFIGLSLVSVGSAYYHWSPSNASLVWDRLPMTVGFMGLLAASVGEYVHQRLGKVVLVPAVLIGLGSVLYWHWTDDLRLYYWVQLAPLLAIPAVMLLFRSAYSHSWLLLVALGWYVLAKVAEIYDATVMSGALGLASGHSLKHILAAAGGFCIVLMLRSRTAIRVEK